MIALPASCSTWILPLLLLHFSISFQLLFSAPTKAMMHEFNRRVRDAEEKVKKCSESCDPAHRNNGSCSCFPFSVSPQDCAFPEYFIKGLESMNRSKSNLFDVKPLIRMIRHIGSYNDTNFNYCPPGVNNTLHRTSPKSLIEKLTSTMQQIETTHHTRD